MSFLNPLFLFGLAALSIPLIIHLINLRKPETLPFSTLTFLEELKKSTIRRLRFKKHLLLFLRIAAIALLALALARPFLPPMAGGIKGGEGPRAIAILLDNSPSMGQIDQEGPFLDQAKKVAREIISQAGEDDRFIIQQTNGEQLAYTLVSPDAALQKLERIRILEKAGYTGMRYKVLNTNLQKAPLARASLYLITDGQKSQLQSLENLSAEHTAEHEKIIGKQVVTVGSRTQRNISVRDVKLKSRMVSRNKPVALEVKIKNYSNEPVENTYVNLQVNGEIEGQYSMDIDGNATKSYMFEMIPGQTGSLKGKVTVEGDEITFDNQYHFVIRVPETRNVLLVKGDAEEGEFKSYIKSTLQAAESTNSQLDFKEVELSGLAQLEWQTADVLIFDGMREIPEYLFSELQHYVQEGSGLVFLPSEKGSITNYNKFLELFNAGKFDGVKGEYGSFRPLARIDDIDESHPVMQEMFDGKPGEQIQMDLPELFYYYEFNPSSKGGTYSILKSTIDDPLLVERVYGEGTVLISAIGADPGWSNFPVNPLFAPLYYRATLYATAMDKGGMASHTLGEPFQWIGHLPQQTVILKTGDVTVKPEVQQVAEGYRVTYAGRRWSPGWLTMESGDLGRQFALNLDNRESDFTRVKEDSLATYFNDKLASGSLIDASQFDKKKLQEVLSKTSFGHEIWHWFVWMAIGVLMLETFLSRWYKAEST